MRCTSWRPCCIRALVSPRPIGRSRTNIEFSALDKPIQTLLVTSAVPGEGKTVTAANLAVVFAQAGRRVLLVDADLRKPGVHIIFDLPNAHGLTTLLRGADVSLDSVVQATEQENLRVLTTGPLPPNPAELAGSKRMRTVVDLLTGAEDLVIFDSPPLQAVTDAAILGSFLDATLFVIDAAAKPASHHPARPRGARQGWRQRPRSGPQPRSRPRRFRSGLRTTEAMEATRALFRHRRPSPTRRDSRPDLSSPSPTSGRSGPPISSTRRSADVDLKRALDVVVGSLALVLAATDPDRSRRVDAAVRRPRTDPVSRPARR